MGDKMRAQWQGGKGKGAAGRDYLGTTWAHDGELSDYLGGMLSRLLLDHKTGDHNFLIKGVVEDQYRGERMI